MRSFIRQLAYRLLGAVAHQILLKYQPKVVAVSGSQGKTSTVEAIYLALVGGGLLARRSFGNYNTEWGVPASIIGVPFSGSKKEGLLKISLGGYFRVLGQGIFLLFKNEPKFPRVLVLEMALDRPGDLSYLTSVAPPLVAVMINVAESHLGFFGSREKLIEEKGRLIEGLKRDGAAVLNIDDSTTPRYAQLASRREARVVTFGQGEGANWRIGSLEQTPDRLRFSISSPSQTLSLSLSVLGRQFAYSAAAALAVADFLGGDLQGALRGIASFQSGPHRMQKIMAGGFLVIDDTYNASYDSFQEALWTLNQIRGERRRVAIIGGIHELGQFAPEIHHRLGKLLASQVDFLAILGSEAPWIREGALSAGMEEGKIKVLEMAQAKEALGLLREGDAVLFKASRTKELDKLVEELRRQAESSK